MVVWELLEDNEFPTVEGDLLEAVRYASLCATKYATRIHKIKVFWVFIEVSIRTWIIRKPHLSPTVHNSLQSVAKFKEDMHNLYIQACKDHPRTWVKLPFIVTDDAIFVVMESWPPDWRTLDFAEMEKIVV